MAVVRCNTVQEEKRDMKRGCVAAWPPLCRETWTILQHYHSTVQL